VAAGLTGELAVNGGCMAILIPSLGFARFDTRGELRFAERLEECVRLTYVGVTRATHETLLTYSSKSALVQRLIA
jgi:hypothetical protein